MCVPEMSKEQPQFHLYFVFRPMTNPPSPFSVSFTFLLFLLSKQHFHVFVVLCSVRISVSSQSPAPFLTVKPSALSGSGTYMRGRFSREEAAAGPRSGRRAAEPLHVCTFSASLFSVSTLFSSITLNKAIVRIA